MYKYIVCSVHSWINFYIQVYTWRVQYFLRDGDHLVWLLAYLKLHTPCSVPLWNLMAGFNPVRNLSRKAFHSGLNNQKVGKSTCLFGILFWELVVHTCKITWIFIANLMTLPQIIVSSSCYAFPGKMKELIYVSCTSTCVIIVLTSSSFFIWNKKAVVDTCQYSRCISYPSCKIFAVPCILTQFKILF